MITRDLIDHLIINLAALIIIANLLSHIHVFQKAILQERRSVKQDFLLSLVFVVIIIVSTSLEVDISSYVLNTRMIGKICCIFHCMFRTAGSRFLSVFSEGKMEIQGSDYSGCVC